MLRDLERHLHTPSPAQLAPPATKPLRLVSYSNACASCPIHTDTDRCALPSTLLPAH